jgi:hypothetical protein
MGTSVSEGGQLGREMAHKFCLGPNFHVIARGKLLYFPSKGRHAEDAAALMEVVARLKNKWSHSSTSPYVFIAWTGTALTFFFFSHLLQMHYMYFAMLLFWTTILLAVVVSLLTKPIPDYMVR